MVIMMMTMIIIKCWNPHLNFSCNLQNKLKFVGPAVILRRVALTEKVNFHNTSFLLEESNIVSKYGHKVVFTSS